MNINIEDITVKIKLRQTGKMLAQAEIIFGNIIETKGWRIMFSDKIHPRFQEGLWIQPPSYRTAWKWNPVIYINNRTLYDLIEEKIYNAYRLERTNTDKQMEEDIEKHILK